MKQASSAARSSDRDVSDESHERSDGRIVTTPHPEILEQQYLDGEIDEDELEARLEPSIAERSCARDEYDLETSVGQSLARDDGQPTRIIPEDSALRDPWLVVGLIIITLIAVSAGPTGVAALLSLGVVAALLAWVAEWD